MENNLCSKNKIKSNYKNNNKNHSSIKMIITLRVMKHQTKTYT